ncbi:hypothetical protein Hypma_000535 [Hypsizygus marmoreus]|uniref:Uncharacterized protein n=1 Tax=Hypsizygus marmoreus TaxID=39966 RepID=A0A369JD01_HYPMA|nr:hypothetical protein Hypma_000535 [Hypsizygus marmoreus]
MKMTFSAVLLHWIIIFYAILRPWILVYYPRLWISASQEFANVGSPVSCLNSTMSATLSQAIECLDKYTVPHDYYDRTTYNLAQPNTEERAAWTTMILSLLNPNDNCSSVYVPDVLSELYLVSLYTESSGLSFCILSEVQVEDGFYRKGWGLMVVPATRTAVLRNLHISAPHPAYDLFTPQQAAALFTSVGAKSLLIPGRSRTSFLHPTECVQPSSGTDYYETDPAHNNLEPFYDATKAIFTWQRANGGCNSNSCAFIQFHGKGPSTCSSDHAFLSSGLGTSPSSISWYKDNVTRPIKRLKAQLQVVFPMWNISLPTDSKCALTATKNVVGRLVNGIEDALVCQHASNAEITTGMFIHVEQAAIARAQQSHDGWRNALIATFELT